MRSRGPLAVIRRMIRQAFCRHVWDSFTIAPDAPRVWVCLRCDKRQVEVIP